MAETSSGEGGEEVMESRNVSYLDFSPQNNVCVTGICETKDASKLFHSEIANVTNFELGGLARDPEEGRLMSR